MCVHVCVLEKQPGLRCSMKICSEQPLSARRGWIRGKLFGGWGHNPICLFTLQQSQIRTIDTLGLVLESKYEREEGRGGGLYIAEKCSKSKFTSRAIAQGAI